MSERAEAVPASQSAAGKRTERRRLKPGLNDVAVGAAIPVVTLVLWQLFCETGDIDPFFFPSPLSIAAAFGELAKTGELFRHIGVSLGRVLAGFGIGGALGLIFGLLSGFSRRTEMMIDPMIQLLRLTPSLALAPLFILWFGFGETSKVLIIATGAYFPLYVNTVLGIRNVDNKLVEVSKALEYGTASLIKKLILPSSLPSILLGIRLSLAVSWLSVVVAEMINSKSGIGYLIYFGQYNSRTELIFVGVIIFAVAGKLIDSLVRYLERKLLGWRDSFKG
ncbi:ABC transporter permease [Paenibacillaceae bacterium WGS1546]|uniref:ABC transporter permease n=1 Tax=Cohnella sp. WGS1546 TaxID=3366810 RepID=UPI00372D68BA